MNVPILPPMRWSCPNCPLEHQTPASAPMTPFHPCSGLRGLQAPMVPAGTKARVVAREREDYIGTETVALTAGRPIMAVDTLRDDGSNDTRVFAPAARVEARSTHGLD